MSGEWYDPDTTYCVKGTYQDIADQVRGINTSKEAEKIVDEIEKVISLDKRTINGGDLLKVIEILDMILQKEPFMLEGDVGSKMNFSFVFVKIVSNMLDKRNEQRWQDIHRNKGVDKGTAAVFEDLEKFDLAASYFIRNYNLSINLAHENIVSTAHVHVEKAALTSFWI
ncbi:uncharacterized protein [Ptychodera flava]|uniref:uncharacterized protein n=1 Tax=Ptychodera flava TaxID=63121 RepID=UPI00396AA328